MTTPTAVETLVERLVGTGMPTGEAVRLITQIVAESNRHLFQILLTEITAKRPMTNAERQKKWRAKRVKEGTRIVDTSETVPRIVDTSETAERIEPETFEKMLNKSEEWVEIDRRLVELYAEHGYQIPDPEATLLWEERGYDPTICYAIVKTGLEQNQGMAFTLGHFDESIARMDARLDALRSRTTFTTGEAQ